MTQLEFDPHLLAHREDPPTSRGAAEKAVQLRQRHHALILETLRGQGALSSRDIALNSGLDYHAVARRMGELRDAGLVVDTGERQVYNGREATVWRVKG